MPVGGATKAGVGAAKQGLEHLEALRRELRAIKYDGVLDEAGCVRTYEQCPRQRSVKSAHLCCCVQNCQGTRGCDPATAQPRPLLLLAPPSAVSG